MADVKQIVITPEGGNSISITHEAGIDISHDTVGVKNEPDRVDGTGQPIVEQTVIPCKCELPNCVDNHVLKTYEKVKEILKSGKPSTVTITHNNGRSMQYLNAFIVGECKLNEKKSTFNMTIQGNTRSGLQS